MAKLLDSTVFDLRGRKGERKTPLRLSERAWQATGETSSPKGTETFKQAAGDLLIELGYERDDNW